MLIVRIILFFFYFIITMSFTSRFKNFKQKFFYNKNQLKYGSNYRRFYKYQMGYLNLVQDHHCIPKQHKDHIVIKTINYDINNCENIIIMPNKIGIKKLNLHPNSIIHQGSHNKYNLFVKEQLDYIWNNYNDIDSYKYQIWLLIKFLKKNMNFNEDNIPWN